MLGSPAVPDSACMTALVCFIRAELSCIRAMHKKGTSIKETQAFMASFSTWLMGFLFSSVEEDMERTMAKMVNKKHMPTATRVIIRNPLLTASWLNTISIKVIGLLSTITFSVPAKMPIIVSRESRILHTVIKKKYARMETLWDSTYIAFS